ncbi:ROK family protein [Paenibacillus harenae]|uniref:ROK family protein n=1 Tax=Paenibacillus harenae TaxID=306543 RepID=UPI00041F21D2|nr:ROK family protein [Paenibacillus harenae]
MTMLLGGVDIGGTKCAVVIGKESGNQIEILAKRSFPTPDSPQETIEALCSAMEQLMLEHHIPALQAIGISCGGPLDSAAGLILSPPNLPGWDRIDAVTPLKERFGVPVGLQNDANACALAEWKWGAGKGTRNMIFLTFGTGMGAGLILDGRLYSGTNDMAGEVGHIRLDPDGPEGYGKPGSFEGYCSGGGIAKLARSMARQWLQEGRTTLLGENPEQLERITAKLVGEAAGAGDELALEVMRTVGRQLGRGLSVLVDVLNPERIVIGSIYARQQALLEPYMLERLHAEALALSLKACAVVPAGLGEQVGDAASLSVAQYALSREQE